MATQLQLVNRVLRRLREDEVTTVVANDYSVLIAEFINAGIEEVNQAHDWERFTQTSYASLTESASRANTANLGLTIGAGGNIESGNVLTDQSKLTWLDHDVPVVLYNFDDYATAIGASDNWTPLSPMSYKEYKYRHTFEDLDQESTVDYPSYVTIHQEADSATGTVYLYASVYPDVSNSGALMVHHWTPPADLELDGTNNDTAVLTPDKPVFEFALMMALNERGEEIGEPNNLSSTRFNTALAYAIENETYFLERTDDYDWRRD